MTGTGADTVKLFVVATAERGLCGGCNSSIVRKARADILEHKAKGGTVKILTIGRKGRDVLRREFAEHLIEHVDLSQVKRLGYANAAGVAESVLARLRRRRVRRGHALLQQVQIGDQPDPDRAAADPADVGGDDVAEAEPVNYEYEPEEDAILADLLPRNLAVQIFRALLENAASEQGARMSAMDNATRNAGEMIDRLTIEYNRSRQAAITKELIEIISGAEAL